MSRYLELTGKVDAFFERVHDRHRSEMQCGSGCSDCCRSRFGVTLVEAMYVAEGLAALSPAARAELTERATAGDPSRCAALDDNGRCGIYTHRPLICRSHGVPIRRREPGKLPVIEVCPRNFTGRDVDSLPESDVLDQQTLSTVLAAVDAELADAAGLARGTRIALADLLADPEQFFAFEDDDETD